MKVAPENKGFLTADHARALQLCGDTPGGVSRPQHDKGLAGWLHRSQDSPGEPTGAANHYYQNEPDELSHGRDSLAEALENHGLTLVMRLFLISET